MSKASTPTSPSSGPGATEPVRPRPGSGTGAGSNTTGDTGAGNNPPPTPCTTCDGKRVIVIDPGHGGTSSVSGSSWNNATAVSGVLEKTLTLQYASSLRSKLLSTSVQRIFQGRGYKSVDVVLTRSTDVNVTSSNRVAVARTNKADILCSIHFNGGVAAARGVETYYKASSNPGQSNLAEDKALAQVVNTALFNAMKRLDAGTKNRGVKPDTETNPKSVGVLRDPGPGHSGKMCRSILIEVEFISNPSVDRLLVSGSGANQNRETLMQAVAEAIANAL